MYSTLWQLLSRSDRGYGRSSSFELGKDSSYGGCAKCSFDSTLQMLESGGPVSFVDPTATDENPTTPDVTCSKNSDEVFPLGTTAVNCEATDAAGNTEPPEASR